MIWIRICRVIQLSSFLQGLDGCDPLFEDLGTLLLDMETREELLEVFAKGLKKNGSLEGFFVWIWKP